MTGQWNNMGLVLSGPVNIFYYVSVTHHPFL